MADDKKDRAVPTSRLGRFARVAKLAGGVAGGMLAGLPVLNGGHEPAGMGMAIQAGLAGAAGYFGGMAVVAGCVIGMVSGALVATLAGTIPGRVGFIKSQKNIRIR